MSSPTILIVEDNPVTRKMLRVALESESYTVLEAGDGQTALDLMAQFRPHLVLQDLLLRDIDGFELVQRLRALPGGAAIPIIAISGLLSRPEEAAGREHGEAGWADFTDYLPKPVEPSRLLDTLRACLQPADRSRERPGRGRQVLVIDDDPAQLKLLRIHLEQLGFRVATAEGGEDALRLARRVPPDAIVSDVLMPRLDGFQLCQAVRQDPALSHLPVVLASSAYVEEADRRLAQAVGANALVVRTPEFLNVTEALLASLEGALPAPAHPAGGAPDVTQLHTQRTFSQLERQASLSASLAQRLAVAEAKLAVLADLAQPLDYTSAIQMLADDLLHHCLNAAGVSRGIAYLLQPDGQLSLRAQLGCWRAAEDELPEFFGHVGLLGQVMEQADIVRVPSPHLPEIQSADLLEKVGARSLLLVPLILGKECLGVLVMASTTLDLGEHWQQFARAMRVQIGQALGLARTLSQLKEREEQLARIVATIPDGVVILDEKNHITLANAAAEATLSLTRSILSGIAYYEPACKITGASGPHLPPERRSLAQLVCTGQTVCGLEGTIELPGGSRVVLLINAAPVRDGTGALVGTVASLTDITERKRAEEELAAAQQHLLQAEVDKKQFYRDVIRAVTDDRLHLVDAQEIAAEGRLVLELPCEEPADCRPLRERIKEITEQVGMRPEIADDLILAAAEGATNAIKHAVEGRCSVYVVSDRVIARVSDRGGGIPPEDLPASLLLPGFSTKRSLGMGFTMMLKLVERIRLATGPDGTVVQLEKWFDPEQLMASRLLAAWE